jgi:tRNA 2-thiouridine synthesizing protein A
MNHSDIILDATGEECPVPLEMARERLATMAAGEVLRILSTDPVSPIDFEAWCMRVPHAYLGAEECDGVWEIRVRLAG